MKDFIKGMCAGKTRWPKNTLPVAFRPDPLRFPPCADGTIFFLVAMIGLSVTLKFNSQIVFAAPGLVTDRVGISENAALTAQLADSGHEFDVMVKILP